MKSSSVLIVLLTLLGLPAAAQEFGFGEEEGFLGDEGLYGETGNGIGEGFLGDERLYGDTGGFGLDDQYGGAADRGLYGGVYASDEYDAYETGYEWTTDEGWFSSWYGEADEGW